MECAVRSFFSLLGCVIGLWTALSCTYAQEHDTRRYIGKNKQIAVLDLAFKSERDARQWRRLYTCLSAKSNASWERYPLRLVGTFAQIDACKGKRAAYGCSGGVLRSTAAAQWWSLSTIHDVKKSFYGYVVSAGNNPDTGDGVGVSLWRSERGQGVMSDRLMIDFSLWERHQVTTRLSIGDTLLYTIRQTRVEVPVIETREALLRMMMSSPESLRALVLRQRGALQQQITNALTKDQVLKCVYDPHQGDGMPPTCVKRTPLNHQERARELKRVELMFKAQRAFIERYAVHMHTQLLKAFPAVCLTQRGAPRRQHE